MGGRAVLVNCKFDELIPALNAKQFDVDSIGALGSIRTHRGPQRFLLRLYPRRPHGTRAAHRAPPGLHLGRGPEDHIRIRRNRVGRLPDRRKRPIAACLRHPGHLRDCHRRDR
ncbi:hypothetical protein [Streptomyces sp. SID1121]|uniref:hypothetical protein n=1 Tax=Streptomyces sp. SID1121 TaxID=3425888 RepID=UPI004055CB09